MFADDALSLFPSVEDAAAYMEWVDVDDGVYEALFTVRAERLVPHPVGKYMVRLEASGEVDIGSLTSRLRQERDRRGTFTADPDDPRAWHRNCTSKNGLGASRDGRAAGAAASMARQAPTRLGHCPTLTS